MGLSQVRKNRRLKSIKGYPRFLMNTNPIHIFFYLSSFSQAQIEDIWRDGLGLTERQKERDREIEKMRRERGKEDF